MNQYLGVPGSTPASSVGSGETLLVATFRMTAP
jgi:hypothetical protein